MNRPDLDLTLAWVRDGTTLFLAHLDQLSDTDLDRPSSLPGWSRAHVAGHLARNADALGRLVSWAHTGVETPMYEDADQRRDDIERTARSAPATLRLDVRVAAERLDVAMRSMDAADRAARVRSASGRVIDAAEIPWLRVREVWLHAVDLRTGVKMADLPAALVDALIDDVTGTFRTRDEMPGLVLSETDGASAWEIPGAGTTHVAGTAAALLGWLVGRTDGVGLESNRGTLPPLPAWL